MWLRYDLLNFEHTLFILRFIFATEHRLECMSRFWSENVFLNKALFYHTSKALFGLLNSQPLFLNVPLRAATFSPENHVQLLLSGYFRDWIKPPLESLKCGNDIPKLHLSAPGFRTPKCTLTWNIKIGSIEKKGLESNRSTDILKAAEEGGYGVLGIVTVS